MEGISKSNQNTTSPRIPHEPLTMKCEVPVESRPQEGIQSMKELIKLLGNRRSHKNENVKLCTNNNNNNNRSARSHSDKESDMPQSGQRKGRSLVANMQGIVQAPAEDWEKGEQYGRNNHDEACSWFETLGSPWLLPQLKALLRRSGIT